MTHPTEGNWRLIEDELKQAAEAQGRAISYVHGNPYVEGRLSLERLARALALRFSVNVTPTQRTTSDA